MSWVNLDDVYVNKTGGTISGDLDITGALTVNSGNGDNTIYNVANEITTLRDSVSQNVKITDENVQWLWVEFPNDFVILSGTWTTTTFTSGWSNALGGSTYSKHGSTVYPFEFRHVYSVQLTTDYGAIISDERFGEGRDTALTRCTYYIVHNQGASGVDKEHKIEALVIGLKQ